MERVYCKRMLLWTVRGYEEYLPSKTVQSAFLIASSTLCIWQKLGISFYVQFQSNTYDDEMVYAFCAWRENFVFVSSVKSFPMNGVQGCTNKGVQVKSSIACSD